MSNKLFMTAQEVADTLGMSKAYAYKLIQEMNQEMAKGGYVVLHGKINRSFFFNKIYGGETKDATGNLLRREDKNVLCIKKIQRLERRE